MTFVELPVAYDGLAVVVNPKNTWTTSMTVEELRTLWTPEAQGKVTRWNQVRPSWPNREIYELAQKYFADRRLGTAFGFGGSQVGVALEELLAEER